MWEQKYSLRIATILTFGSLTLSVNRQKAYLVEEPRAEDDLEEVVRDEYVSKLKGLAVLHEPRAQHLD